MTQNFLKYTQNSLKIKSVLELDSVFLEKNNIDGLIFDFDGVLNGDGQLYPTTDIAEYLSNLCQTHPVAIYSNAHLPRRKEYIKKHFPEIHWVDIPPKKPCPKALLHLASIWDIPLEKILMVDDRLLTGGLSAFRAKTQFAHVVSPLTHFLTNPIREIFFSFIRLGEKVLIRLFNFH